MLTEDKEIEYTTIAPLRLLTRVFVKWILLEITCFTLIVISMEWMGDEGIWYIIHHFAQIIAILYCVIPGFLIYIVPEKYLMKLFCESDDRAQHYFAWQWERYKGKI